MVGGTKARRMRPHMRVRCMHGWLGGRFQLGRSQKGGRCKKTPSESGGTHGVGRTEDVLLSGAGAGIRRDRHTHRSHFCDKLFTTIHRGTTRLGTKTRTSLHATVPSRARLCVGPIIYMRTPQAPKKEEASPLSPQIITYTGQGNAGKDRMQTAQPHPVPLPSPHLLISTRLEHNSPDP